MSDETSNGRNRLKSKHYNTREEWMDVWNNYKDVQTKEFTEEMIADAVSEIKEICAGKVPAYAWSGGKDSIALQIVCEDAGIKKGFCCYNDLYFQKSIDFFYEHCPEGVEIVNTGEDIAWLSRNPKFLFPKGAVAWNVRTHLRYQPIYCKKNNVDILLMGKRRQDGNWVPDNIVNRSSGGVDIYCPLRHWTHENVICAIRHRGKTLSRFYLDDEIGFHFGDTKFAIMGPSRGESVCDAWNRIYSVEKMKVIQCAEHGIESAREYLNKKREGYY
ncbi:MAG: hypothetical protein MJY95_08360 [Bacteroidaceae bacterium]|nr:hypothetical protein [Bacteroidaceae bacterium]